MSGGNEKWNAQAFAAIRSSVAARRGARKRSSPRSDRDQRRQQNDDKREETVESVHLRRPTKVFRERHLQTADENERGTHPDLDFVVPPAEERCQQDDDFEDHDYASEGHVGVKRLCISEDESGNEVHLGVNKRYHGGGCDRMEHSGGPPNRRHGFFVTVRQGQQRPFPRRPQDGQPAATLELTVRTRVSVSCISWPQWHAGA